MKPNKMKLMALKDLSNLMDEKMNPKAKSVAVEKVTIAKPEMEDSGEEKEMEAPGPMSEVSKEEPDMMMGGEKLLTKIKSLVGDSLDESELAELEEALKQEA